MKIRKLFYMGIEKIESRYTLQLTEWNRRIFDARALDVVYVEGQNIDNSQKISVGQVLDAHGRSFFSMSQMMNLVQMMQRGEVTNEDVVYFEDMFTPGIESLPYILNQVPESMKPRIYVRCLAQSIDPDDFVHVTNMNKWMGLYEQMVNQFVTGVLASNEEMVAHMKIAGWTAPIYNISGLAFGKSEVLERIGGIEKVTPFTNRPMSVGFAARWDREKNPDFYMDLIEYWHKKHPTTTVAFSLFSGSELRSNDPIYITRARELQKQGLLTINENLKKNDYYSLLNNTRVVFSSSMQDWVSNVVSEADTLGCNVLYPAYRSFPETFSNDADRLYVPWSIEDACNKLEVLLTDLHANYGKISNWTNGTIDRICDIMEGNGEHLNRSMNNYRKYTVESKF